MIRLIVRPAAEADIANAQTWYSEKDSGLSDEFIDQAVAGSERHFAGERDASLPISDGYSDWRPGDGDGVRNCEYVALQNRQMRRLLASRGKLSASLIEASHITRAPNTYIRRFGSLIAAYRRIGYDANERQRATSERFLTHGGHDIQSGH